MSRSVIVMPEAEDQLGELYRFIAAAGSAEVAARYLEAIVERYSVQLGGSRAAVG